MALVITFFVLGNFIWEWWGVTTATVFIRAVWLTGIVGIFAIGIAIVLSPNLSFEVWHVLQNDADVSANPIQFKFDAFKWLVTGMMTSFWVSYSFLKAEFTSKFTMIRSEHDKLPDRINFNTGHLIFDSKGESFEIDIVVLNWAEDVLLFNLNKHESFRKSFEHFLGLYSLYLEKISANHELIQNEFDSYPKMNRALLRLNNFELTKLKSEANKRLERERKIYLYSQSASSNIDRLGA